jgi:hypothetical protein
MVSEFWEKRGFILGFEISLVIREHLAESDFVFISLWLICETHTLVLHLESFLYTRLHPNIEL